MSLKEQGTLRHFWRARSPLLPWTDWTRSGLRMDHRAPRAQPRRDKPSPVGLCNSARENISPLSNSPGFGTDSRQWRWRCAPTCRGSPCPRTLGYEDPRHPARSSYSFSHAIHQKLIISHYRKATLDSPADGRHLCSHRFHHWHCRHGERHAALGMPMVCFRSQPSLSLRAGER